MSFVKIDNDVIDSLTIELHPSYKYTSKTDAAGAVTTTGAINVKARGDKVLKDVYEPSSVMTDEAMAHYDSLLAGPFGMFGEEWVRSLISAMYEESPRNIEAFLSAIRNKSESETDIYSEIEDLMGGDKLYSIGNRDHSSKNDVQIEVARFEPPFEYSYESAIKNIIKNNLMKEHITDIDHSEYSFTNYNSINFFTSADVPSDSVIMYPTPPASGDDDHPLGRYIPDGAFSMDFYINPRYQNDSDSVEFKAGTIMHLSSTYALSLVPGTQKDENGLTNAFRIMLQLSHSADVLPSSIDTTVANNDSVSPERAYPNDLIFVSEDNSLKLNNWHHVTVRWGTDTVNFGTGSIRIDNTSETYFSVPSSSITPVTNGGLIGNTDVFFIGNYYEGRNSTTFNSETSRFFYGERDTDADTSSGIVKYDGLAWQGNNYESVELGLTVPHWPETEMNPALYKFDHPLNAEIQELKLYSKYLNTNELVDFALTNPADFVMSGSLMFYLPPSFVRESPLRYVRFSPSDVRGAELLQTTRNPFNEFYSLKSNAREMNLENYFREFRKEIYPRFFNLSISALYTANESDEDVLADDWGYGNENFRKRNLTVLPSDNGLFKPTYSHLLSGSIEDVDDENHPYQKFKNSLNVVDLSKIDLNRTFEGSSIGLHDHNVYVALRGEAVTTSTDGDILTEGGDGSDGSAEAQADSLLGAFGARDTYSGGDVYPMYQEYRDDSSNEVTIFDITNLSYGNSIQKNTFSLYDSSLRGSDGKVNMTLKDNGRGSLYRADCLTKQATWNSVGNVFYDEGIVIVKAPTIPYFGRDQFELSLKGSQNLHVMTIDAKAKKGYINKSTNSSYLPVSASFDVNNPDNSFVYISGINYHDENLNVIMRTNLTQPIKKKEEDEFVFRTKFDW